MWDLQEIRIDVGDEVHGKANALEALVFVGTVSRRKRAMLRSWGKARSIRR